jgi:hypothetical protein
LLTAFQAGLFERDSVDIAKSQLCEAIKFNVLRIIYNVIYQQRKAPTGLGPPAPGAHVLRGFVDGAQQRFSGKGKEVYVGHAKSDPKRITQEPTP